MFFHNHSSKELKIAVLSSKQKKCVEILNFFSSHIKVHPIEDADVIVCLGGDGFMLHTLHTCINYQKPIYGINCGNLGFLMNDFNIYNSIDIVIEELKSFTKAIKIYPLEIKVITNDNKEFTGIAFNEASLLRKDGIAAHLKIYVDEQLRCSKLVSDGALVSTPLGSLAYNKACGGAIIPLDSKLLVLTAINPFEPHNFKGAILPDNSIIKMDVLSSTTRKVNLFCDFLKFSNISSIEIKKAKNKYVNILYSNKHHLTQKISNAQFMR